MSVWGPLVVVVVVVACVAPAMLAASDPWRRATYCRFFSHRFDGWDATGAVPGEPLPWAYCSRCGREF